MDALLTPWKLMMLPLLLLLSWQWLIDDVAGGAKLRTWAALYLSSVLGWWLTPAVGSTPYLTYIVLCIAGAAVTLRDWKGEAQHAIGLLFGGMALIHFGGMMAGHSDPGKLYRWVLIGIGWAQLAILLLWGLWDAGLGKALRFSRDRLRTALHLAPRHNSQQGRDA